MLRVGIIGCGDIANLNVLGYLGSQDTELISVCDTDINFLLISQSRQIE